MSVEEGPNNGFTMEGDIPNDCGLDGPAPKPPPNAPKGEVLSAEEPNEVADAPAAKAPNPFDKPELLPEPNIGVEEPLLFVDEMLPNENAPSDVVVDFAEKSNLTGVPDPNITPLFSGLV